MLVSSSGNQIINTTTTSPNHNNHHHHHATSSSSSPPSSSAPNSSSADPPITLITSTNGNNTTPTNNKRKRRPAGTPDPDAEVVSLSPKTLLESDRYVCEICNQGFQRDQNLQMHRRRHKVPWKLLKRDNTSGSQTATRKRVFVCPEPTCLHHDPTHALGDLVGIKKHFRRKHSNHKQWVCGRCSKAYAVQSDYKAHLKTCGTRGHSCDCGRVFSRVESFIEHQDACHMGRLRPDHHHHHPHQSPGTANANANANAAPPLSTTTLHQQQHPPPPSSSSVCLSRTGSSPSPSHDNTIPPLYWPPPPPPQQQQQQQPPCTLPVLHHITAASPPNNLSTNNSTNTSYQNNNNNIIVNDDVDRTTTLRNTLRPDQITTISVHNLELQLLTSCTTAPTPSIINHNQTPTQQQQHHLSPVSKTPPNHLPYSTSTHLQLSIGSSSDTTTGDKHHNDHLSTETSVSDKKPDDHSTATVLLGTGIKEEACEQLRLAMAEKAYAEEARREAKRQVEIAEREFSNAKRIRQRAQAELDKANTLKEQAVRQISDTLLQITCHACKQQFDQEVVLLRSGILHHQQLEEGNHEE